MNTRGVDVGRVSAVLARLLETGKPLGAFDHATGEVVPLSPRLAAAPHGVLPVFLAAADTVWRKATGRSLGLDVQPDPQALLGNRVHAIRHPAFAPVMLCWGGRPLRHHVAGLELSPRPAEEPSAMAFKGIAVDTSKSVFTLHGVDEHGHPVLRQDLTRAWFETFLGKTSPTEVVLEACGSSHHWGRVAQALGHTVRLMPASYVKPYVKRGKTDAADAEAIGEAASRPTMRFVPVKPAEIQAEAMDLNA